MRAIITQLLLLIVLPPAYWTDLCRVRLNPCMYLSDCNNVDILNAC